LQGYADADYWLTEALETDPEVMRELGGPIERASAAMTIELAALALAWEQASDEYGRLIVEWVTGGFQRLGGAVTA
jgi:hypothetical protein